MKNEEKKQMLKDLIDQTEKNIYRAEVEERFLQRKRVGGQQPAIYERILGKVQHQIKEDKDRISFYEEILKEL